MQMDPTTSSPSLASVVELAQCGDNAAVEELVRRCRDMATRYAFGVLRDRALAEDVAQEALAHAVESIGGLKVPQAFIPWFRKIVYRYCDRIIREKRPTVVPLADLVEPANGDPSPEELVLRAERALAVRAAIARLPDAQRDAATTFYLEGLTQAEAAHALGISVSTINNRLHAARRTLERNLAFMNDHATSQADTGPRVSAPVPGADSERIFSVLESISPAGADWRQGRLSESRFDWSTSRIGIEGNDLRALVGVYDLSMRVGRSTVRTAGFNLDYKAPATSAETMSHVTAEVADAARTAGYGLAVSVGQSDALRAAGFVDAWPHLMWFVPTGSLPRSESPRLTTFDPVHRDDTADLCDREHAGLTGTTIRPTYLANKEPDGFEAVLWTDDAGAVAGYVSYAVVESWNNPALLGPSHHGYGRLLWHDESAGDPTIRVTVLADLARRHDCPEIAFDRLHPRSPLARRLVQHRHRVENGYRHYAVQVLALETSLRSILGELNHRLASSPIIEDVNLRMSIGDQSATLSGPPGHLDVRDSTGREPDAIEGDQRLANLLVGTDTAASVLRDATVTGNGARLAVALFPTQDPQMDNQAL